MAADPDGDDEAARPPGPTPPAPPPETYKVARSTEDFELVNTIDLAKDFPFSV